MQFTEKEIKLLNDEDSSGEDLYTIYKDYEYNDDTSDTNKRKGLIFLKESAVRRHGKALFILSTKSLDGDIGIEINHKISGRLLEDSAGAGFHKAAFVLSNKYRKGSPAEGIKSDLEKSNYWLKISAGYQEDRQGVAFYTSNGHPMAQRIVSFQHLSGSDEFTKNPKIAINLLISASRKGCKTGDGMAQKELFFLVMIRKKRRALKRFLSNDRIDKIREHLVKNMPSHHPVFQSQFPRILVNEYIDKQKLKTQYTI